MASKSSFKDMTSGRYKGTLGTEGAAACGPVGEGFESGTDWEVPILGVTFGVTASTIV
jgi:hypothetical protein